MTLRSDKEETNVSLSTKTESPLQIVIKYGLVFNDTQFQNQLEKNDIISHIVSKQLHLN